MDTRDRIDQLQSDLRAARDPKQLRANVDLLLDLFTSGDEVSAAIELCKGVLRRADELNLSSEHSIRYATVLLRCLRRRGAIVEALALAEEILNRLASHTIPAEDSVTALCAVATTAIAAGEYDRAEQLLCQAEPHAVASGNTECLAIYYTTRGHVFARLRAFNDAVACFQTGALLHRLAGKTAREVSAAGHAARAHMLAGRFRLAADAFAAAVDLRGLTRKASVTIAVNHSIWV